MYLNQQHIIAVASLLPSGEIVSRRLGETEPRCKVDIPSNAKVVVTMDADAVIKWEGELPRLAFTLDEEQTISSTKDPLAIAATLLEGGDLEFPDKRYFLPNFAPLAKIKQWLDTTSEEEICKTFEHNPGLVQPVMAALEA